MGSLILRTATQFLLPLLILASIFLLIRGHNEPGGGFVGGLLAAAAVVLFGIAYDTASARAMLRLDPHTIIGIGLLLSLVSGLIPIAVGRLPLTGLWTTLPTPLAGELHVGTPLLFDLGVFLVVIGVTLNVILTLLDE